MSLTLDCFKYRSGAAALRSLSEGTLYFAAPSELNDCLEAKFEPASGSHFSEVFNRTIIEISRQRGEPWQVIEPAREAANQMEAMQKTENLRFYEDCQRVGIFSASKRPDSQPMWAYYCDNNRGFCFELQLTPAIFERFGLFPADVTYTREARVHNRAQDFRDLLLLYAQENPNWPMAKLKELSLSEDFRRRCGMMTTSRAVSNKHADWQHEQEVRVIAARSGSKPILQDVLKRVNFMRTDFEQWGSIMVLLSRLYPKVEIAQLSFHHTEPFVRAKDMVRKLIPL